MEVYLNIVEFGDGIYGCEAAAQHYFGKSAKNLTANESA
jgi:monofunctional biosynthetic peptidoglycan transglycosylase